MATVTEFRGALQDLLKDAYRFEFVAGRIDPPQENKPIGCVWHEGKRMWARDANQAEVFYRVRIFPTFAVQQGTTTDAARVQALEEQEELLETTLKPVLTSLAAEHGHHLLVLSEVSIDQDAQMVEGQILAWQRNLAAAGG